jgi:hypothetical protein
MAKPLDLDQADEAKEYVKQQLKGKQAKERFDKEIKSGKGFYGYFEGLEKPPKSKGKKSDDLLKLLKELKTLKPFFRDKEPEMTPLVHYFYCRYMASWLINNGMAKNSLDMTKHMAMGKVGNSLDRYKMYSELIENVYGDDDDFLERLFPFDRVATVGSKPGMLQKQYGMLRAEERKKFRNLSTKIRIPVRDKTKKGTKKYGYTVAYYLSKYLKDGIRLTDLRRDMPVVLDKTTRSKVFLEAGAYLVGTGFSIEGAEDPRRKVIDEWYFGDTIPDDPIEKEKWEKSTEVDEYLVEEFLLRYMPSATNEDKDFSHFILEPNDENPTSVYLKNSKIFVKDGNKPVIFWVSEGETFLPPHPNEYKSFEALGYVVEAQMAHFATTASEVENKGPNNAFEEVHVGLLGNKNKPGIAVYHANIFYHLLLAQARDPIANFNTVDQDIFASGRLISIEAYLGSPLKLMAYWLMSLRDYVEFKGIDPKTDSPRIVAPERVSVSQAIVDETAKAEMTNALSKLMIGYYRCMFGMLKNKATEYPKTMKAPREGKDTLGKKERKSYGDFIDLRGLWDDLLKDVTDLVSKQKRIEPSIVSEILNYMYSNGKGVVTYPATMNPEIIENETNWGAEEVAKWLKFSYAANPTSVDTYIECASAVYAAIGVSDYMKAEDHVEGVKRFLAAVEAQGGYHYLIAILSLDESDALPDAESFRPKNYESFMPSGTRKNPSKLKKKAEPDQEYMVNIELELPVEVDLDNLPNELQNEATKLFDRIYEGLEEAGIDEPAHIGTNGTTLDIGWYVTGLDGAIDLLAHVTELYSDLGIAGRGWLEWGQEEMRKNYTVDGYSLDDI